MEPKPSQFQQLVEEMTSGLKDDTELRLDVCRELNAHFEDSKAALREEGKSEEESDALALKAFGEPTQITEHLADSNRNRMKFRAAASMFLGRILVPLSLVMAVWMGVHYAQRLSLLSLTQVADFSVGDPDSFIPEQANFLFYGDESRPTKSAQQRAIWEKNPENEAYFSNYMRHLLTDFQSESVDIPFTDMEQEIRCGESLDPENAYYNYLMAALLFERGAEIDYPKKGVEREAEWIVKDDALLTTAVDELKKAELKPTYRRYIADINAERLGQLPESRRIEESIAKLGYLTAILLPEISHAQRLFRAIPYYVQNEPKGLSEEDAILLLNAWQQFTRKTNKDTYCLIDVLVLNAIISDASEKTTDVYKAKGLPDAAEQTSLLSRNLSEPCARWKAGIPTNNQSQMQQKAGMLAGMMLPALGEHVNEQALRPGRLIDYVIVEQFTLSLVLLSSVGFLIGAWVLYMICRRVANGGRAPFLLLPMWNVTLRILGLGILLPVFLYLAYTRWTGWSSHEYSLPLAAPRNALEFLLLAVTYLALSVGLATAYIRKRCRTLNVAMPARKSVIWRNAFWGGLTSAWIICLAMPGRFDIDAGEVILIFLGLGLNLIFFLACIVVLVKGCLARRTHGLYYGTLARSLMPVYACSVLFIGGICLPYLQKLESSLLQQDKILLSDAREGAFTSLETQVTQRLSSELEAAFNATQR